MSNDILVKMTATDLELLQRYARNKSEESFTALVNRHLNLIYSAALRQVRSPQLAEEVAQSVFTDLARNAHRLAPWDGRVRDGARSENDNPTGRPRGTILTAWLYQVTRRTAIDVVRREARRQLREQIASEMNTMNATVADWTHIAPLLDEAMHALDDTDRAAVLLRYFENKSLREVGATLGTSDDAAQKRVSRAVERLREFFAQRGVTVGASGLVLVISANAVQAAPVGLAITIAASVAAATMTTATIATHTTMNWITAKTMTAIVFAAVVAGTGTHLVQQREVNRLRSVNQNLMAQQNQLTTERDAALSAVSQRNDEVEQSRKDKNELLRLRGEVGQLRRQTNEIARLTAENRQLRAQPAVAQAQVISSDQTSINQCINSLRRIDGAIQQCALEYHLSATNVLTAEQIRPYFKENQVPQCPLGGTYTFGRPDQIPSCTIPGHAIPTSNSGVIGQP